MINIIDQQGLSSVILGSYVIIIYLLLSSIVYRDKAITISYTFIDCLITFSLFYIISTSINSSPLAFVNHLTFFILYIHLRFSQKLNHTIIYIGILLSSFTLSSYGYLQYLGFISSNNSYFPITGQFQNPAPYGGFLGFHLLAIASVLLLKKNEMKSGLLLTATAIMIYSFPAFVLSGSRASWLACGVGLLFALYHKHSVKIKSLSTKVKFSSLLVLISIAVFISIGLFMLKPDSARGRILIWKISVGMIFENPIVGLGHGGVEAYFMHFQEKYFREGNSSVEEQFLAGNNHSSFNEPLRLWIEYGIVGFILYLLLIYFILFRTQTTSIVTIVLKAILIMFFVFGLFSYPCRIFEHKLVFIIAFAMLVNYQKQFSLNLSNQTFKVLRAARIVIMAIVLCILINQHYLLYKCNNSILAYYAKENDEILTDLEFFSKAIPNNNVLLFFYSTIAKREEQDSLFFEKIKQYAALHPTNRMYIQQGDYLKTQKQYDDAEKQYWKAHYMVPSQQKARTHIAILYNETGRIDEAKQMARNLLNEKVKIYGFETFELHEKLERILKQ